MCGFKDVVELFFSEFNNRALKTLDEAEKKKITDRISQPIIRPQK